MKTKIKSKKASRIDWSDIHRRLEQAQRMVNEVYEPDQDRRQRILRERAIELARPHFSSKDAAPPSSFLEVIEFVAGGERYAFETQYVGGVHPIGPITPIPGVPPFVTGIYAAQGEILSIVDLRVLLDLPLSRLAEPSSIIVLQGQAMEFGILAEDILGVVHISHDSIERELPTLTDLATTYLKGVSAARTAILSAEHLLSESRLIVEMA